MSITQVNFPPFFSQKLFCRCIDIDSYSIEELKQVKILVNKEFKLGFSFYHEFLYAKTTVCQLINKLLIPYFDNPLHIDSFVGEINPKFHCIHWFHTQSDIDADDYFRYLRLIHEDKQTFRSQVDSHFLFRTKICNYQLFALPFHILFIKEVWKDCNRPIIDSSIVEYFRRVGTFIEQKTIQLRQLVQTEIARANLDDFRDLYSIILDYV